MPINKALPFPSLCRREYKETISVASSQSLYEYKRLFQNGEGEVVCLQEEAPKTSQKSLALCGANPEVVALEIGEGTALWGACASPRVGFGVPPNTVFRRDAEKCTRGFA